MSDKVQRGPLSELDIEDLYELAAAVSNLVEAAQAVVIEGPPIVKPHVATEECCVQCDLNFALSAIDAAMGKK